MADEHRLISEINNALGVVQKELYSVAEHELRIARLNDELDRFKDVISKLNRVVLEGNGTQPLTTRIILIEESLSKLNNSILLDKADLHKDLENLNTYLNAYIKEQENLKKEILNRVIWLVTTVAPGILGFFIFILQILGVINLSPNKPQSLNLPSISLSRLV